MARENTQSQICPDLPLEKPICRSGSNWTLNNRLVPNSKRSTSRPYIVTKYIMRNAGLEEAQESGLPGEISITSDRQMTPLLWQKVKRN